MMEGARFPAVFAVVLMIGSLFGIAPSVDAGPKVRVLQTRSNAVAPGKAVTQKIACPKRMTVLSGGVKTTSGVLVALAESLPYDGKDRDRLRDDGWRATAINLDADPISMRTYVVCAKGIPTAHQASVVDVSPGLAIEVLACPPDMEVVGGGVGLQTKDPGTRTTIMTSIDGGDADTEPNDLWRAEMYNPTGGPLEMTTAAICAEGTHDHPTGTTSTGGLGQEASATCSDGKTIVGGGASFTITGPQVSIQSSYPDGASWRSTGSNTQSGTGIDQSVLAVCR